MAIFKENIDVVNPEGSDANDSRKSEITFYGFLSTDESLNEAFSGIGDTIYTDADNTPGTALNDATFGGTYELHTTPTYTVEIDSVGATDTFKYSKDNFVTTIASGVSLTTSPITLDTGVTITFGAITGHGLGDQWQMTVISSTSEAHELAKFVASHEGTGTDHKSSMSLSINTDGYPSDAIFSGSGLNDLTFGGRYNNNNKELIRQGYYVKIDSTGNPNTFAWSKDNFVTTESTGVNITGSAQTLEHGVTVTFAATTGHTLNDVWTSFVYDDNIKIFSNNLVKFSGDVVQANGNLVSFRVYDADGNILNTA